MLTFMEILYSYSVAEMLFLPGGIVVKSGVMILIITEHVGH